jgi:protein SCO1
VRPYPALALAVALAAAVLTPTRARALPLGQALHGQDPITNDTLPKVLEAVGIDEKLGGALPLETVFTNQDGERVRLADLVGHGRPVILSLVYFNCPMLCELVMSGEARAMRESGFELGKDFDAVTLSFDPRDSTALALERQRGYLQALGRPQARGAWTFLTGSEREVKAVAAAAGFGYAYDEKTGQFAHPAAIFVLTPDGHLSRYLYGIEYPPKDLRLALVEAGQGRVGTSFDRILLTCYRYDPARRQYVPYAMGIMRVGMLAVLCGVGLMLGVFWRRELRNWRAGPGRAGTTAGKKATEVERR